MRFKFRVWHKIEKYWLDTPNGLFFRIPNGGFGEYVGEFMETPSTFEVQQFTGLLDKNGVEIYEGDILKWIKPPYIAAGNNEYEDWCAAGKPMNTHYLAVDYYAPSFRHCGTDSAYGFNHYNGEVAGNIFQNLELLENKL